MIDQAGQNPGPGTGELGRLLLDPRQGDAEVRAALVAALAGAQRPADTIALWSVGGVLLLAGVALLALLALLAHGTPKEQVELAFTAFMGLYFGLLGLLMGVPGRARAG